MIQVRGDDLAEFLTGIWGSNWAMPNVYATVFIIGLHCIVDDHQACIMFILCKLPQVSGTNRLIVFMHTANCNRSLAEACIF